MNDERARAAAIQLSKCSQKGRDALAAAGAPMNDVAPALQASSSVSSATPAGRDEQHPFPGEWQWWASYDGGEFYSIGPAVDRDDILQMVREDCCGEHQTDSGEWRLAALIGEMRENHIDLAEWFHVDRFLENAGERMDENDCGSDDEGERHPLSEITPEQRLDLEASVRRVMREWQKRHGLKLRSWWFAGSQNIEQVDLPHPGEADLLDRSERAQPEATTKEEM